MNDKVENTQNDQGDEVELSGQVDQSKLVDQDAQNDRKSSNVILIGMPGSGKSTLGVLLARLFGYDFIDADLLLQQQMSRTLERVIEALGPEGFLEVENELLCNLEIDNTVLATGGSAVYSDDAMMHLRDMGRTVYLLIDYEEVCRRLTDLPERGVVRRHGAEMSLRELYDERETLYERYADITVDVNGLTATDAAHKIAEAIEPYLKI